MHLLADFGDFLGNLWFAGMCTAVSGGACFVLGYWVRSKKRF